MKRRYFLTALPLTACLAGCMNRSAREATTPETTTARKTTTAPEPATVREVTVQFRSSYRYVVNVDGIAVKPPRQDQFAFVSPPVSGAPPPSAFDLMLGDELFSPATSSPGLENMSTTPGIDDVYTKDNRNGVLMFDIPTTDVERAALLYDDTRYPLTDDARNRLARAPDFSLESVSVPDSVAPGEYIELSITVSNDGDAAGMYLAGFRYSGLPKEIDLPVDPGETGTDSVAYGVEPQDESMVFDFDYPGGSRDYEVTVESESTTERS